MLMYFSNSRCGMATIQERQLLKFFCSILPEVRQLIERGVCLSKYAVVREPTSATKP